MEQRHLIKGEKQWRSISELGGCQPWTFALSEYFSFQVGSLQKLSKSHSLGCNYTATGVQIGAAALKLISHGAVLNC